MASEADVAWLAGLLEGEGHFAVRHRTNDNHRPCLVAMVKMTDEDVIQRAADMFPAAGKVRKSFDTRSDKFSDCYRKDWNGADAEKVMRAILPYMGERRAAKIRECLATPNLSHQPKVKA